MELGTRGRVHGPGSPLRAAAVPVLVRTFSVWLGVLPKLAAIAACVWVPTYLVQFLLATSLGLTGQLATLSAVSGHVARSGGTLSSADTASLQSVVVMVGLYVLLSLLLTWIALAASQAALLRAGADAETTGTVDPRSVRAAVRAAIGRLLAAWAITVLILLGGSALVVAAGAALIYLAGWLGSGVLILAVVALVLVGLTLVPLAVFARLALAAPLIVLEDSAAMESLRRSSRILKPYFGTVFLVLVVLGFAGWLGSLLFSIPGRLAPGNAQLAVSIAFAALGAAILAPLPQVGLVVLYRAVRSNTQNR